MSVTYEKLRDEILEWDIANEHLDVMTRDGIIIEKLFREMPVTDRKKRFFGEYTDKVIRRAVFIRRRRSTNDDMLRIVGHEVAENASLGGYTGFVDIGHTAPDFENLFRYGLKGLLERLEKHAEGEHTERERLYYEEGVRVWRAAVDYVGRAATAVQDRELSEALANLAKRPPKTLFEAIQLTIIYFELQQIFDNSDVRTLGRLDALYEPFRVADVESGRLDEEGVRALFSDMYRHLDEWHIPANIPFAVGGIGKDGKSAVNKTSYLLVEEYAKLAPAYVKLHMLCTEDMPSDIVKTALDAVRRGANSICFFGDATVTRSLTELGEDGDDARDYAVVGCYECGGRGEVTCSCNARVNIPKAVELAINFGRDMESGKALGVPYEREPASYGEFFEEFLRQLKSLCDSAISLTNAHESLYNRIHTAPILSATYDACVESGRDVYADGGAKYSNSSLNAFGIATAVDSLYSIKKLVYDDGVIGLSQLREILADNWEGNEALRLRALKKLAKYGMGFEEIDATAALIVEKLSEYVNKKPNAKGGIFRLGTFSINWRWEFGQKTAATPDGRRCGEPISQNSSASVGADRLGVTAHIASATRQNFKLTPNGSVLDLDLHSSAVCGEEGLNALYATLMTFVKRGGFAVHYNVLDADTLRRAVRNPEDYPNLQVRLCGWNVLFSTLTRAEQEEFIKRAEASE